MSAEVNFSRTRIAYQTLHNLARGPTPLESLGQEILIFLSSRVCFIDPDESPVHV